MKLMRCQNLFPEYLTRYNFAIKSENLVLKNIILHLLFLMTSKFGKILASYMKISFHNVLVKLQTDQDFAQTLSNFNV